MDTRSAPSQTHVAPSGAACGPRLWSARACQRNARAAPGGSRAQRRHAYGLPYKAQAFSNLEALTRLAETDSAVDQLSARKSHVARWIVSYLHTLRTLGNEASHAVQERGERFPNRLEADDLIVLLSQVRRVLDFRLRWRVMRVTSS